MVSITVYDGCRTIGGNKIYVEEKGHGLFLDFGMNFARYGTYFQDFLKERETRGLHDLIHLDLIPRINAYRRDLVPSDLDLSGFPKLNVDAVILSHAHIDHCGNIPLLDLRIPVVASGMTTSILKALWDLGASDVACMTLRKPSEKYGGLVLPADGEKPYTGRDFFCTDSHEGIHDFMSYRPGNEKARKQLKPGCLGGLCELQTGWEVEPFPVDHSIYGATAYILGSDKSIAYTGDLRLSGKNSGLTERFVKGASGASVLICEGTRVGRKEDANVTEREVFWNCLEVAKESKRLIVADFSARNFERLDMFHDIAKRAGRQLVITAKDAYMLDAIGCSDGTDRLGSSTTLIYEELLVSERKWETEKQDEWGGKYVGHEEIRKNPGNFILCFSFYDLKHLLDIKPRCGTYIYSSSEAFSEEQEFDFRRLKAWLDRFSFDVHGFRMEGEPGSERPIFDKGFHASGHVSRDELEEVARRIDPDCIVPVHTEDPRWFEDTFKGDFRVLLPEEGKRYEL
jgi:ribonuclease J